MSTSLTTTLNPSLSSGLKALAVVGKTRYLFAIGEGVPIVEALDQASCILYAAHLSNAYLNEAEDNDLKVRQALCLQLELARALVESVIEAVKG
jgi:hypothetical protein